MSETDYREETKSYPQDAAKEDNWQSNIKLTNEDALSTEEESGVKAIMSQIDIYDMQYILRYGSVAQQDVSEIADSTFKSVKIKESGEVSSNIDKLVKDINKITSKRRSFWRLLFKKSDNQTNVNKAVYGKEKSELMRIRSQLEAYDRALMKDCEWLKLMLEKNLKSLNKITLYIVAGKRKLEELKITELPRVKKLAENGNDFQSRQAEDDLLKLMDAFEGKINDLIISKNISAQLIPQIYLILDSNEKMISRLRPAILNVTTLCTIQEIAGSNK